VSVRLARGGPLLPWYVASGCELLSFRELKPLAAGHQLPETALHSVLASLDDLEPQRIPLREAIALDYQCQELGALKLTAEQFRELRDTAGPSSRLPQPPKGDQATRDFIRQRLPRLQAWDALIAELSTHPYYEVRGRIPEEPRDLPERYAGVLAPVPGSRLLTDAHLQCEWRAMRIMVLSELWRQEHGRYPRALDELSGLSAEHKEDPFSGRQLVYRLQGDTYLLYSTGADREDNGGEWGKAGWGRDAGTDLVLWPRRKD
jgi:hypothetical protein